MIGKVVLITGGSSGIGKATAVALARRGATVVVAARNRDRGRRALADVRAAGPETEAALVELDLASFASIARGADEVLQRFPRLDVLVNCAGGIRSTRSETEDGFETTFGVNHLGHFLLVALLHERLRASAPARVITLTSTAHWFAPFGLDFHDLQSTRRYDGLQAYARSKLANIYFTRELARRTAGTGVTANSVCPGLVASDFAREGDTHGLLRLVARFSRPIAMSPEMGAQTPVYLATSPTVGASSGRHFMFRAPALVSWAALDRAAARRLWDVSEALLARPRPARPQPARSAS